MGVEKWMWPWPDVRHARRGARESTAEAAVEDAKEEEKEEEATVPTAIDEAHNIDG